MTRKEAIDIINSSPLFWCRPTTEEQEALWMAVEALNAQLSTEDTTKCTTLHVQIFADGMPLEEYLTREWNKQRTYLEEHGIIFRDGGTE